MTADHAAAAYAAGERLVLLENAVKVMYPSGLPEFPDWEMVLRVADYLHIGVMPTAS